ncbi:MAG TPA: VTT domain-containing protein [Bryobacterales bacterium]|nr:VTT domain-containing protein [Bryobacterales bacterium]
MHHALRFLDQHAYTIVFAFALAEQMGLPIPALPVLLAVGALAGLGKLSLGMALAAATTASLLSDSFWYELGRRRGHSVLRLLCRISLEPDSCVRRTEGVFAKTGACALIVAKFVPGLSTVAPPLAGVIGMEWWRFLLCAGAGGLLWAGVLLGAGFLFRTEIERVAAPALRMGSGLVVLAVAGLAAYVLWKWIERERFMRKLRVARIRPEELHRRLQSGEKVVIVDLRHSLDFEGESVKLPGAIHMLPEELEQRERDIPRDREVVLYCS